MIVYLKSDFKRNTNILFRIKAKIKGLFLSKNFLFNNTPVIINNFNRLFYLELLIDWLEKAGMRKIYIIDNLSTYPPLLDFYKKTKYTVFRLDKNVGHEALWKTHLNMLFVNNYYIYTDPDIIPIELCPLNFINYFIEILNKYPEYTKIGFGLKIDDLPDYYQRKNEVILWENQYWTDEIEKGIYKARTDTTFALYRPGIMFQQWDRTLRTGYPYIARHLPWYVDTSNPTEEESYFRKITTKISSWYKDEEYFG